MKQLLIKLKGDRVKVDAIGFEGPACETVLQEIDQIMSIESREHKSEMYTEEETVESEEGN